MSDDEPSANAVELNQRMYNVLKRAGEERANDLNACARSAQQFFEMMQQQRRERLDDREMIRSLVKIKTRLNRIERHEQCE